MIKNILFEFGFSKINQSPISFLDFASGYGRVSRFLSAEPNTNVFVCDVKNDAVDFAVSFLGCRGIYFEDFWSGENKFDVIYVGSLFSHLPLDMFKKYLLKLLDSLNPGGILIFSTHGNEQSFFSLSSGFKFVELSEDLIFSEVGDHIDSMSTYGSTYVSRKFVENLLKSNKIFNHKFHRNLLGGNQDIYIIQK